LKTHSVKLHYSEAGQGTPVVLLHGFPLASEIWTQQRQALAAHCRVITPDLRGHGQSPAPARGYEMESLAGEVLALLDSLKIERAAILGHSMGGYVTLAAWRLAPKRCLALGLIDSHAGADTAEGRQGRMQLAEKVAAQGSQVAADAMLPKLFAPGLVGTGRVAGDPIWEHVRELILNTPPAGIIGALHGMAARPDCNSMLPAIDVPVLVVAGDGDLIIPLAKAQALAAAIPKSTLRVISNAGHMTMLEQPAATTAAIDEFLRAAGFRS
jgi:pimeloyl-ACP methyl ester carboxylesterase